MLTTRGRRELRAVVAGGTHRGVHVIQRLILQDTGAGRAVPQPWGPFGPHRPWPVVSEQELGFQTCSSPSAARGAHVHSVYPSLGGVGQPAVR